MTRLPRFVMWILSATMFVAAHSCARVQETAPSAPREAAPEEDAPGGLRSLSDGACTGGCSVVCVAGEEPTFYESGVTFPCAREFLRVSSDEHMEIRFTVTDENATDLYEYGYQKCETCR